MELEKLQRCARSRRVILLLATLIILGLADLHLTVHHHTTIGMEELNPIGAYFLQNDQILGLVIFKFVCMGIATGTLLAARTRPIGEVSTWFAFGIMVALTFHWHQYNTELTTNFTGDYVGLSEQLQISLVSSAP